MQVTRRGHVATGQGSRTPCVLPKRPSRRQTLNRPKAFASVPASVVQQEQQQQLEALPLPTRVENVADDKK